jgi:hypothetical protein
MPMEGKFMLRTQVIEWNEPWNTRDRARVAAALEAIPDGRCVLPNAGTHIGVWIKGHIALKVFPGYLEWPGVDNRWNKDLPPDLFPEMQGDGHSEWHGLSTFQHKGP